jgi:hypothetical protein
LEAIFGTIIELNHTKGIPMNVVCPHCGVKLVIGKDDILGKFYICPKCHWAFSWEENLNKKSE